MRIKWNRHLDGSSNRQPEEGSATQVDEKKPSASSSPGIFRIFKRKKKTRRSEDEVKPGTNNNIGQSDLQQEADDAECASITSIATCASQPVSDGFTRDRASSLFSSFRLSLPGSKRKKRKIAPAPSDTILNGQQQQNEPQTERYSTPDLRKPSDKLVLPNDPQVSLSTSSPSLRHPKGSLNSAQSLDTQKAESSYKLHLNGTSSATTSRSKLSKSVSFSDCKVTSVDSSFSDCKVTSVDSSHSTSDNPTPQAAKSFTTVEEDSRAVESELPSCLSDNLREFKLTSFEDPSTIGANVTSPQKKPGDAVVNTVDMTKTEEIRKENNISDIDNILSDIVSEIQSYSKDDGGIPESFSAQGNHVPSSKSDSTIERDNAVSGVQDTNNERYVVRVNFETSPGVPHVETRSVVSPVPEWNTCCEEYPTSDCEIVLRNKDNDYTVRQSDFDQCFAKVPLKDLHSSSIPKLVVAVTPFNDSSIIDSFESYPNKQDVGDINCDTDRSLSTDTNCDSTVIEKFDDSVSKQIEITKNKHVVCHMRVCQNADEILSKNLDDTDPSNAHSFTSENASAKGLCENFSEKIDSLTTDDFTNLCSNGKESLDLKQTERNFISTFNLFPISDHCSSPLSNDLDDFNSKFTNLIVQNEKECDQEVPDNQFSALKYSLMKEQEVPEFELSLLEFEEMCNKYMSPKDIHFSDCTSVTLPHFINSPRRKSVLNLNYPFVYSPYASDDSKVSLNNVGNSVFSGDFGDIKHNFDTCNNDPLDSCQSPTDQYSLPLPPKQWINYGKPIENDCSRDVCTDRVQRTKVRGKNLCQEPCLEAFPSTVMHGEPDLGGIDTPQLSPTLETQEDKSGREITSTVAGEKQVLPDDHNTPENIVSKVGVTISNLNVVLDYVSEASGKDSVCIDTVKEHQPMCNDPSSPEDMVSKVGATISNIRAVLDYSYLSEAESEDSIYLNPKIRESYRIQRGICDPAIYIAEGTKALESLGSKRYLGDHNFTDIRNIGLRDVIKDVSCDYVQGGQGLIEISNPYQDDSFIISHGIHNQNFINGFPLSTTNVDNDAKNCVGNSDSNLACSDAMDTLQVNVPKQTNVETSGQKLTLEIHCDQKLTGEEKITPNKSVETIKCNSSKRKSDTLISDENIQRTENRLSHTEKKNMINKNKNSMIPCRTKIPRGTELKRIETKLKSKKADTIPRFSKTESIHIKSNGSLRNFSNSYKDSDVGFIGKQKNNSITKLNGIYSRLSPTVSLNSEVENKDNSESTICQDSGYCAQLEIKLSTLSNKSLATSDFSDDMKNLDLKSDSSSVVFNSSAAKKCENDEVKIVHSSTLTKPEIYSLSRYNTLNTTFVLSSKPDLSLANGKSEAKVLDELYSECPSSVLNDEYQIDTPSECSESTNCQIDPKTMDILLRSRCSSLPVGMVKRSFTSSKESLNSELTSSSTRGKSRIPKKQPGSRGVQPSGKGGPVRPPMWLSKAELTQEIQRLGTLCESRTKELNRLKMETKHVSVGFDAFAALFKYMVEDLNALSVPTLTEDLEKTLKQLELTKQDLAFYEREVEEIKSHHCQELNDLSNKLFEVYHCEVAELNAKHKEEINHLKSDHEKQIEHLTTTFDTSAAETKAHHEKLITSLEQEIVHQREELQLFQEREIKDLENKHVESTKLLHDHIEQLQKKCAELKQHSMSMEDAMQKDTDSKLQWVSAAKSDLEKEVESLKAVLEMKNKELHTLRVQNLEMEKQLEELPISREKIKMLHARAEDLEALMIEKTKIERKLCTENQQIKDTYEKESKVNRRLSMENEELQWRLRQAENSIISGSFSEVPEFPEVEGEAATSPLKSPGPQVLSRSVFFTFMDKDDNSPRSPRSQYKKITPGFSASYKTSPAKSSKSPPGPSPRRMKSHSEPPQPAIATSTPRKNAKLPFSRSKGPNKRQRSESDANPNRQVGETAEGFSSVAGSMASSVSSESSVFEHKERQFLEEHREQIFHSLEILREQRSAEMSTDEPTLMEKKWCSDDIKVIGELPNLETEDMSRSAEFADPKTYYHMTFAVLKEPSDNDDGKNSSSGNSPMKEVMSPMKHSKSEDNISKCVDDDMHTIQVMSTSVQEVSTVAHIIGSEGSSCSELALSPENAQEDTSSNIDSHWRTI